MHLYIPVFGSKSIYTRIYTYMYVYEFVVWGLGATVPKSDRVPPNRQYLQNVREGESVRIRGCESVRVRECERVRVRE